MLTIRDQTRYAFLQCLEPFGLAGHEITFTA